MEHDTCASQWATETHGRLRVAECRHYVTGVDRLGEMRSPAFEKPMRRHPAGAFYSIAFTFGNYLLLSSTIFGPLPVLQFLSAGRDKSRMPQLMASSFRYLVLTSIPLHFIAVALAAPALLLLYAPVRGRGHGRYHCPAALHAQGISRAHPKPSAKRRAPELCHPSDVLAGIVDIGVAWTLIPVHGAVGACIGSGARRSRRGNHVGHRYLSLQGATAVGVPREGRVY